MRKLHEEHHEAKQKAQEDSNMGNTEEIAEEENELQREQCMGKETGRGGDRLIFRLFSMPATSSLTHVELRDATFQHVGMQVIYRTCSLVDI